MWIPLQGIEVDSENRILMTVHHLAVVFYSIILRGVWHMRRENQDTQYHSVQYVLAGGVASVGTTRRIAISDEVQYMHV